jgi:hypothetical protein
MLLMVVVLAVVAELLFTVTFHAQLFVLVVLAVVGVGYSLVLVVLVVLVVVLDLMVVREVAEQVLEVLLEEAVVGERWVEMQTQHLLAVWLDMVERL